MMGKDFENPWALKTPSGKIKMMSSILNSGVFPGSQGGPLEHIIAAKSKVHFKKRYLQILLSMENKLFQILKKWLNVLSIKDIK